MWLLTFVKKWSIPVSIGVGAVSYVVFAFVNKLQEVGFCVGPLLVSSLPYGMFFILYVTFCKIKLHDMRPKSWFWGIELLRLTLALVLALILCKTENPSIKLPLEGVFVCIMCPTATAAAVVVEKLGGDTASLTLFTIVDNLITSIAIPLLFPLVERQIDIPFLFTFMLVLRNTTVVLVAPFVLAMLTRRLLPRLCRIICNVHDMGFYLWCVNLSIVTGLTLHNIIFSNVSHLTLSWLLLTPFAVTLFLFSTGKIIGYKSGDNISAGQAMGQKNTVVAIWLTTTFLNPLAAVAPGAYVLWQNVVNAWQLWYKEKYGRVKW